MPERAHERPRENRTLLAFDYGKRRIGVAVGVESARSASPLASISVRDSGPDWSALQGLLKEWRPDLLVVGLPVHRDGRPHELTAAVRVFAHELGTRSGVPVTFVDERLSSFEARARLREQRQSGSRRRRVAKKDVDPLAAAVILETWLEQPPRQEAPLGMELQHDEQGGLRHLLRLEGLEPRQVTDLLDRAQSYVRGTGELPAREPILVGRTVANLFFEPSTRTRVSFELAALRLGADVVNLDLRTSSRKKGESILDTIYTLQAMQTDIFVLRDTNVGTPQNIASHVGPQVSVINAGEAHVAHPTQGLLDVLTIRQHKPDIANLTIAIIGDIKHSRVARSTASALRLLGHQKLRLVGPEEFLPDETEFSGAERTTNLADGLHNADVVMTLRIQKERMAALETPDVDAYASEYGLTGKRLQLARPDAIVMHPGPMNREVEISSEVADGPQSVIVEQVANGVAVRMAVMATLMKNLHPAPG